MSMQPVKTISNNFRNFYKFILTWINSWSSVKQKLEVFIVVLDTVIAFWAAVFLFVYILITYQVDKLSSDVD